jgi:hypothetical protein
MGLVISGVSVWQLRRGKVFEWGVGSKEYVVKSEERRVKSEERRVVKKCKPHRTVRAAATSFQERSSQEILSKS